jgi:acetyl esterase/lipase
MAYHCPSRPEAVLVEDDSVLGRHGPIPIRRYRPAGRPATVVVWVHGGAFSHGGLDQRESHDVSLALADSGFEAVAVDYRLVPPWSWWRRPRPGVLGGTRYPIPLEDVIDATTIVHQEASQAGLPLILGGASAGACLSAAAALRTSAEGSPTPDRLVLAYGTYHAALPPLPTHIRARVRSIHGLMQFRPETVERMNRNYAGCPEAMDDPHAFPGGHDLSGLPPTLCIDADRDSLRASGEQFARELGLAGVDVSHCVVEGSTHGFLDRPQAAAFDEGIRRIAHWIRAQLAPTN